MKFNQLPKWKEGNISKKQMQVSIIKYWRRQYFGKKEGGGHRRNDDHKKRNTRQMISHGEILTSKNGCFHVCFFGNVLCIWKMENKTCLLAFFSIFPRNQLIYASRLHLTGKSSASILTSST